MTEEKFQMILSRQMPDSEKRKRADFIIDTGLGIEHAERRVGEILEQLKK
jgi:dephospho-CoA kinase